MKHLRISTRIFLVMAAATACFLLLALGVLGSLVRNFLADQFAADLQSSSRAYERYAEVREDHLSDKARALAQMPFVRAVMSTDELDIETVVHAASTIRDAADAPLIAVCAPNGAAIAHALGATAERSTPEAWEGLTRLLEEPGRAGWVSFRGDLFIMVAVPIESFDALVGNLAIGIRIDQEAADEIASALGHDVTLVHEGRAVAASWGESLHESLDASWVASARSLESPSSVNWNGVDYLALSIRDTDDKARIVVSYSLADLRDAIDRAQGILALVGLAVGALTLALSRLVAGQISRPLRALTDAARSFSAGETVPRVELETGGELGVLGSTFNEMTASIEIQNQKLRIAKERAEKSSNAKSDFIANVSHELRTPLHAILSFASFGTKRWEHAKPSRLRGYFENIAESGHALLVLVEDILELTELEAGRVELRYARECVASLCREAMSELSVECRLRGLVIDVRAAAEPVEADIDGMRLRQVIQRLLKNAIKYAPPDSEIVVNVGRSGDSTRVEVADRGPGLPQGELEAIFDKFVQSSITKDGSGGVGLGLSIAREIVLAHGGRIEARNQAGGGAVFAFEIPTSVASDAVADEKRPAA